MPKVALQSELANVDWLHGGAEAFLTLSNILVVLGVPPGGVVQHRQKTAKPAD